MPYTLKIEQVAVKDPQTGEYTGVDVLAEQTKEGLIAELQAEGARQQALIVADVDSAEENALKSEGFAIGEQDGTAVGSTSPYYHNNAEYFRDQATSSAMAASGSATAAAGSATAAAASAAYAQAFTGAPRVAATAAAMTDTDLIYVYTGSESGYTAGNWYYYNGSAWASGGVYNSGAVNVDATLAIEGAAADAAACGAIKSDLSFNEIYANSGIYTIPSSDIEQGAIAATGLDSDSTTRLRTKTPVLVKNGISIAFKAGTNTLGAYWYFYPVSGSVTHASAWLADGERVTFTADGYVRIMFRKSSSATITPSDYDATLKVYTEIASEIDAIDTAVKYIASDGEIDLSQQKTYNCTIRDSNLLTVSGTDYQSIQIPTYHNIKRITVTASSAWALITFLKTSLPDNPTNGQNISSRLATGETSRRGVAPNTSKTFTLSEDTAYIVIAKLSNGSNVMPTKATYENGIQRTEKINILIVGNSFSQDSFAYLPPVLNEMLPEYEINYGVAYEGSAGIDTHITMYNNNTAYTWFNRWDNNESKWVRYASSKTLAQIVDDASWDIVYVQPHGDIADISTNAVTYGRQFLKLMKTLISHQFAFLMGQWLIANSSMSSMKTAMETIQANLGVNGVIPIGTGIANARTNTILEALGTSGDMLYDSIHQQSGIPALISTYVIALYLARMIGKGDRTVYNNTFYPTTENCVAINAYKTEGMTSPYPMTHGDSVGVTADNVEAAQEIAMLAINNPFVVTDCSDILDE